MKAFTARYQGICEVCYKPIYPGDTIRYKDGDTIHANHRRPKTTSSICPICCLAQPCECEE